MSFLLQLTVEKGKNFGWQKKSRDLKKVSDNIAHILKIQDTMVGYKNVLKNLMEFVPQLY